MTVTIEQMSDRLIDLPRIESILGATEPLTATDITTESRTRFRLQPGWEASLDALNDTSLVEAFITVDGVERQMTKEAALQATSQVGLPQALVGRSPSSLIEPFLNHWWSGDMGGKAFKALSHGDQVSAFTKSTLTPFSNLDLLENIQQAVQARYGTGTRIFADYKAEHSLQSTNIRLILPDIQHAIQDSGMGDVPTGGHDDWLGGIHFRNSLVGKGQTSIEPYLFRWWCTNGATTERRLNGAWSRQGNDGQNLESVYEWARQAVDEVLGGMEAEFESIQALTSLSIAGNVADVLTDVFERYSLPVSQRESIRENLEAQNGRLTMYSVMQAITQAANDPDLAPDRADRLMRIGGAVPSTEFDPLKARIWREGHLADQAALNPYEVRNTAQGGAVSSLSTVSNPSVATVVYDAPAPARASTSSLAERARQVLGG